MARENRVSIRLDQDLARRLDDLAAQRGSLRRLGVVSDLIMKHVKRPIKPLRYLQIYLDDDELAAVDAAAAKAKLQRSRWIRRLLREVLNEAD